MAEAFEDGFEYGEAHGNIQWKHPPLPIAFLVSQTRRLVAGEPPEELMKMHDEWAEMTATECADWWDRHPNAWEYVQP